MRRGKGVPRMASYGLVRVAGMLGGPGWAVAPATGIPGAARDLMYVLQGLARASMPGFRYLWIHISRAHVPRLKFRLPTESYVVSLAPACRVYRMAAGAIAEAEHCALETMVSYTVPPFLPHELPLHMKLELEDAGFTVPGETGTCIALQTT